MKPVMYIFANRGLGMSPGKLAAQVAHASVEAFRLSEQHLIAAWDLGRHNTKIVLLAENSEQLRSTASYLDDRGFIGFLVIDEGRTEIPALSPTALGIPIVDKDDPHTAATFSSFQTYREEPRFKLPDDYTCYRHVDSRDHLNRRGRGYLNDLSKG